MKAAILAAGCATRLRPHTDDCPKTLLDVGGQAILERSLRTLAACGFDEFVIGTGYLEDQVRHAVTHWLPTLQVRYVTNPVFRSTNNAYSLMLLASELAGESFILLDGDVVYERSIIRGLLDRGPDCLAVRSVGGIGEEEVKVRADRRDRIMAIGKEVPVRGAMGESVGIELFSAATSRKLFSILDERMNKRGLVNEYYEAAFQQLIEEGSALYGVDIGTQYATEIDTYEDLVAANAQVRAPDLRIAV